MKILYILEPAIELGNPEFRFATLRSSLICQIKALNNNGHQTHIIMGESIAKISMEQGYLKELKSVSAINHYEWTGGENYLCRSIRHQNKDFKEDEIEKLARLIKEHLPQDFLPDIIFVWESPMYFLEKIFPLSRVMYQTPGIFSRPPFPEFIRFDGGLLEKSKPFPLDLDKSSLHDAIENLRVLDQNYFRSLNLVEPLITPLKQKYNGLILLPLQIERYFMVDSLLDGKTQFDILLDLLEKIPTNIGLLVTNYWSGNLRSAVLSEQNIRYLRTKFNNFIYIEKLNTIPFVSQLILPLIDGVYTVSSSVGFQAAYWGKPVFSINNSHVNKYNTALNFQEFIDQVSEKIEVFQDGYLMYDILNFHFPLDWINNKPKKFCQWVNSLINQEDLFSWSSEEDFLVNFKSLRREDLYLKQAGLEKLSYSGHSIYHCTNLSEQIRKHDVVSFDIFDTLLIRPFQRPSDLFDFIVDEVSEIMSCSDIDFKNIRRQSESLAFQSALSRNEGETTIDEIYNFFQFLTNCTTEVAEQVKQLEMKMEFDLLYERKTAKNAYNLALSMGKRVILISDMYLPRSFIEKILEKNGYLRYEKIYVSSEFKQKKHTGLLYEIVLSDIGVSSDRILHIGDNLKSDVVKAKEKGIKPFHLPNTQQVFEKSDAYKQLWIRDEERQNLYAKMLIAFIGNTLHDNPYLPSRRGTLFSGDSWRLGYYGLGVFLLGYVKWLLEEAIADKVERLYFLSRDGLIMKKAYDLISKNYINAPQSYYLLCSRRAVNLAKIRDESGIVDLLNVDFSQSSLGHLLHSRFGLNESDLNIEFFSKKGLSLTTKVNASHRPILRDILIEHKEKIFEIALRERENYLQYLEKNKIFDDGKVAVVDIGYAGTMQESLNELAGCRKEINGYYLITFRDALQRVKKKGVFAKAYLANYVDRHDTFHPFCKFVPLYETLFSSVDTSLIKFEKDWNGSLQAIYMNRSAREETRENMVARTHEGALYFIEKFSLVFGKWIKKIDIEPNKSLRVLNQYFSRPHPVDAKIMSGVVFEDFYGGAGFKTILSESIKEDVRIVWSEGQSAIKSSGYIKDEKYPEIKAWEKRLIEYLLKKTLTEKKFKKFTSAPNAFFLDSKKIGSGLIRKIYFYRSSN
jgi:HAD superfamily hydrolase (TIGR01549 family)